MLQSTSLKSSMTLSIDIAQKVLQEELTDQKKQQSLVEKLVNDIEIK